MDNLNSVANILITAGPTTCPFCLEAYWSEDGHPDNGCLQKLMPSLLAINTVLKSLNGQSNHNVYKAAYGYDRFGACLCWLNDTADLRSIRNFTVVYRFRYIDGRWQIVYNEPAWL